MLLDMHAHSSGISHCCKIPYEEVIRQNREKGIEAIVLTNHYVKNYVRDNNPKELAERYNKEFFEAFEYGKKVDYKVFYGIEVTMELYPNVHMLVYGVAPEFLTDNPEVYELTQEELYNLVHKNGGILVQAHPYRNGTTVMKTDYLDGIEINSHPSYGKSYADELIKIGKEKKLFLTSGGDYHADNYRPVCGMMVPEKIETDEGLKAYLLSDEEKTLVIHEPNTEKPYEITLK